MLIDIINPYYYIIKRRENQMNQEEKERNEEQEEEDKTWEKIINIVTIVILACACIFVLALGITVTLSVIELNDRYDKLLYIPIEQEGYTQKQLGKMYYEKFNINVVD